MNHIQLVTDEDNPSFPIQFYLPDHSGHNWSCVSPLFDVESISNKFLLDNNLDFISTITNAINNNMYVVTYVNEYYVPDTWAYKKKQNFNHMIMIYGVDETNNTFTICGYEDNSKFMIEKSIQSENLSLAYYNNHFDDPYVSGKLYCMKLRNDKNSVISLNLKFLIDKLKNYVDSKSDVQSIYDYRSNKNIKYGLSIYDNLIKLLYSYSEGSLPINITPIHILMEHKLIMIERLKYLESIFQNLNLSAFIEKYTELAQIAATIRNKLLKLKILNQTKDVVSVINKIETIRKYERDVLSDLIAYLEQYLELR